MPPPVPLLSTYLDPGVVSLIEVMCCLFYWSRVFFFMHQWRGHPLACTFHLSKQTLDLCFEAFMNQNHPLQSGTGCLIWGGGECWFFPDTQHPNYIHAGKDVHQHRSHWYTQVESINTKNFSFTGVTIKMKTPFYMCDCIMLKTGR